MRSLKWAWQNGKLNLYGRPVDPEMQPLTGSEDRKYAAAETLWGLGGVHCLRGHPSSRFRTAALLCTVGSVDWSAMGQMLGERNTARLCSSLQGSNGPGAKTMVFCVKTWFA
ncbi:MAG: hypothetical protein CL681_20305 [Blastopirellula sp.]|nr:hypothetical protein [Blastopirellula sp.]